ncbi:hypothetical protein [Burkholderia vietnamiensis]|uniref:hypothetical protein n=1 Tax=Burkholderia vietnamiensis TaxID=60552 RepID=UPI000A6D0C00|nr:hypothetical protein [Burkholderia vietnamiensis]
MNTASTLTKQFRVQLVVWAYKIWTFAKIKISKRANDLRRICIAYLDRKIRSMHENFLMYGRRTSDDELIGYVISRLIRNPASEKEFDAAFNRRQLTNKLISECEKDPKVQRTLAIYFASIAFVYNMLGNSPETAKYEELSSSHLPTLKPLRPEDVNKYYKEISRETAKLYWEITERTAIKFTPSITGITSTFGVISGIMIAAGVLYTSTLLGSIGIKASLFFGVSDYLSTALDQIRSALIAVALSVGLCLYEIRSVSLRAPIAYTKKRARIEFALFLGITLLLAGDIAFKAWKGEVDSGAIIGLGSILAYKISAKLCNSIFHWNLITYVFISGILIFTTNATASLLQEINSIKKGQWGDKENITITPKPDSKIKTTNLVVIDANSSYIFAIDKKTRIATAIPKDQIAEFEMSRK